MSRQTVVDVAALSDDRIDELARSLSPFVPTAERAARGRRALLLAADEQTPEPRGWFRWTYALVAPAAVAVGLALWVWLGAEGPTLAPRVGEGPAPRAAVAYRGAVTAAEGARVERVSAAPDEIVRVTEGVAAFAVDALADGERFRVVTADGEVEVRGTRFEVVVEAGRLVAVNVSEGRVDVRVDGRLEASLTPGQRWERDAAVDVREQASPTPPPMTLGGSQEPAVREHGRSRTAPAPASEVEDADAAAIEGVKPLAAPPALPAPGEDQFRRGWTRLRASDPAGAAHAFAEACAAAGEDALAEDACYWAAVAWKRAGEARRASEALAAFLRDHARSARAGEAAALLGWLRVDAGELDEAQRLFELARADRVPSVRDSAAAGLRAVEAARR